MEGNQDSQREDSKGIQGTAMLGGVNIQPQRACVAGGRAGQSPWGKSYISKVWAKRDSYWFVPSPQEALSGVSSAPSLQRNQMLSIPEPTDGALLISLPAASFHDEASLSLLSPFLTVGHICGC